MSILVTCLCLQAGAEAGKKPELGNKMELLEVPFIIKLCDHDLVGFIKHTIFKCIKRNPFNDYDLNYLIIVQLAQPLLLDLPIHKISLTMTKPRKISIFFILLISKCLLNQRFII